MLLLTPRRIYLKFLRRFSIALPVDRTVTTEYLKQVELHWGDSVDKTATVSLANDARKAYILPMFPYPSGNLHMGHIRVYTASDCIARFFRLNQYQVIHPIGWDAFGLPAENAAIERKIAPQKWTQENIASMKLQLKRLGCAFNWDRELSTCDPAYYKWTQLIFLKMFEAGLAYQSESQVNWDPVDKTVLADEQIDSEGRSWRSGAKVLRKPLRQWFIRTTQFSKELLEDLSTSRDWKDVAVLQRYWVGKLDFYRFLLPLKGLDDSIGILLKDPVEFCKVTTIFIRSSHILSRHSSLTAVHPFDGREIPIVVNDQLPFNDGQDCMAVRKDISVEIDKLLSSMGNDRQTATEVFDRQTVLKMAEERKAGGYLVSASLRDWPISRQRYWGTPIPIVHCPKCKAQPVPQSSLPVTLPHTDSLSSEKKGDDVASPLASMEDWVKTECPKCGGPARRETDTLDTFFDSSWYFLRYLDPNNVDLPFKREEVDRWMPVDVYVGGKEHALLHLFLARFFCHFLYKIGWLGTKEPFGTLLPQGMIMGRSYQRKDTGEYLQPSQVNRDDTKKLKDLDGHEVVETWEKMSKSKHNGVDPTEVFDKFGTDMTRLLITFAAAPHKDRNWDTNDLHMIGYRRAERFLSRICKLVGEFVKLSQSGTGGTTVDPQEKSVVELRSSFNYSCRFATHHMSSSFLFHDTLKLLEELINTLKHSPPGYVQNCEEFERSLLSVVIMLYPFAPHVSAEFWSHLQTARVKRPDRWQMDRPVWEQKWPEVDADFTTVFLQYWVNDNFYGQVQLDKAKLDQLTATEVLEMALGAKLLQNRLDRKDVIDYRLHKMDKFGAFIDVVTKDGVIGKPDKRKAVKKVISTSV